MTGNNMQNDTKTPWWRHFEGKNEPEIVFTEQSLQAYLDEAAEKYGNEKAIIFQNYTLNYKQLKDKSEAFAAALRLNGVQTGDRVAIMLPNIPQTIIAVWGVLKAGAVAVMTNPLYMEKELTHHFHDADANVLITLDLLWPKIEGLYDKLNLRLSIVTRVADGLAFPLNYLQPWKAKREGNLPNVNYDGKSIVKWADLIKTKERYNAKIDDPKTNIAFLQYTGGTTGVAKAAMLSHQNVSAQMQILKYIVDAPADKKYTFLSILPFFHIFGLAGNILLPALYGAASIPVPRYTPADLLRTIDKYRPNFFIGVPSVYISLIQKKHIPKYDLSCIELCISGSAPFPKEAMTRFQKLTGANVTEGLGLTEASPCITANPVYGLQKEGSVGVCLPATEVRIVDMETGDTEMPRGELGEIVLRGPQVMLGYWKNEEETALTIRDGWLHTGDIGYQDEDGYFFVSDRKKDMVIVGGYNVYPREVDEVLYEHPHVAEAVVVGIPHRTRGEVLKAFIVVKEGMELTVAELTSHCREKLAGYKVPKFFEFCDDLPKTLIGKVLRRTLREQEVQKLKDSGEFDKEVIEEDFVDEALDAQRGKDKSAQMRAQAEAMLNEAKEKGETMLNEAREKSEAMMNEAKKKAEVALVEAREKAEKLLAEAKDVAGKKMQDAKDVAGKKMQDAKEKAEEVSRTFSNNVDKALKNVRKTEKETDNVMEESDESAKNMDKPEENTKNTPSN